MRYRRFPGPRHVPLQPRGMPLQKTRTQGHLYGGGRIADTVSCLPVKSSNAAERSNSVTELAAPSPAGWVEALPARGAPDQDRAARDAHCKSLFPAGNATEPPANHRRRSSPNPPGTKFAEILCLPAWHCAKEAV